MGQHGWNARTLCEWTSQKQRKTNTAWCHLHTDSKIGELRNREQNRGSQGLRGRGEVERCWPKYVQTSSKKMRKFWDLVNNTVLYTWKLRRANLKCSHQKKGSEFCDLLEVLAKAKVVIRLQYASAANQHVVHNVTCQLQLNRLGEDGKSHCSSAHWPHALLPAHFISLTMKKHFNCARNSCHLDKLGM